MGDDNTLIVRFDRRTITLDALQRAAYALAKAMTVDIRVDGNDFACAVLTATSDDWTAVEERFRREVFDQALRVRIGQETEQVRNLIFAVAFSRTGLINTDPPAEGPE